MFENTKLKSYFVFVLTHQNMFRIRNPFLVHVPKSLSIKKKKKDNAKTKTKENKAEFVVGVKGF
jgi:hypothetical protein